MPFTASFGVGVRLTRPAVLAVALIAVAMLAPAEASAGHRAKMATATGASDAGGPEVATAVHRPRMFFDGARPTRFYYRVESRQRTDVTIKVVKPRSGKVLARWRRGDVGDGEMRSIKWSGVGDGRLQRERRYAFRLIARDDDGDRTVSASSGDRSRDVFKLWHHRFPIVGSHQYWDGWGAGRGHQGTDIGAPCGTPLRTVRGGTVQYAGYHSAAGYYAVVDARRTGVDFAYMHLQSPAARSTGQRIRTGEVIGRVGESGNASGCHLHFEMWSAPGWYEGGSAFDSEPHLRRWDRYS